MSSDKSILVFPTSILHEIGYFQGINFNIKPYLDRILSEDVSCLVPNRRALEKDPSKKQIISYTIIEANGKILFYLRSKDHGEGRLAGKWSIGFGGHVSDIDASCPSIREIYNAGAKREINEELIIDSLFEDKIIAVINDDSDDVGKVHFGIVHLRRLKEPRVQRNDDEIKEMAFISLNELKLQKKTLENWTKMCVDKIDEILLY